MLSRTMIVTVHKCLYGWQATIQGFQSRGLSTNEAEDLLQRSVRIAQEERDRVWKESQNREHARTARAGSNLRALVAASIGSYGAYLADGSEYRYASTPPFSSGLKLFWSIRIITSETSARLECLEH